MSAMGMHCNKCMAITKVDDDGDCSFCGLSYTNTEMDKADMKSAINKLRDEVVIHTPSDFGDFLEKFKSKEFDEAVKKKAELLDDKLSKKAAEMEALNIKVHRRDQMVKALGETLFRAYEAFGPVTITVHHNAAELKKAYDQIRWVEKGFDNRVFDEWASISQPEGVELGQPEDMHVFLINDMRDGVEKEDHAFAFEFRKAPGLPSSIDLIQELKDL